MNVLLWLHRQRSGIEWRLKEMSRRRKRTVAKRVAFLALVVAVFALLAVCLWETVQNIPVWARIMYVLGYGWMRCIGAITDAFER